MNSIKGVAVAIILSLVSVSVYAQEVSGTTDPEQAEKIARGLTSLFVLSLIWGIPVLIGWYIGKGKGRGVAGFWFSFFLGPIGWIITGLLEPTEEVQIARTMRSIALTKAANSREKHEE